MPSLTIWWLRDHVAGEVGGDIEPMIERLEARCRDSPSSRRRQTGMGASRAVRAPKTVPQSVFERRRLFNPRASGCPCARRIGQRGVALMLKGRPPAAPAVLLKLRGSWPSQPCQHAGRTGEAGTIRGIGCPPISSIKRHRATWNAAGSAYRSRFPRPAPTSRWSAPHLAGRIRPTARPQPDRRPGGLADRDHPTRSARIAERKVERELLEDLKRVSGKQNLLFNLADATLAQPDGVVRDVVFPVVGEQTLRDLVKWKATGPTYRITLRTVIRNSYQGHYRAWYRPCWPRWNSAPTTTATAR